VIAPSRVAAFSDTIGLQSEPGPGARFKFLLPFARLSDTSPAGSFMNASPSPFDIRRLPENYDVLAPDGSEIRVLPGVAGASMAHQVASPWR
jgi:hypothetical protein